MNHHETLPPSSFPALQKCYHFTKGAGTIGEAAVNWNPEASDSPYAQRGTRIDELTMELIHQYQTGARTTSPLKGANDAGEWDCASWIASETIKLIPDIRGLQTKIEIDDPITKEAITFGTCDVWGYSPEMLALVDAKSGLYRDYMAQLAVYALGLMDREDENECLAYCVFGDQKRVEEYRFTMSFCEELLASTISGINNPDSPYNRNNYCEWCSLRPRCPAWLAPASLSLSAIKPELGVKLREGLDLLLNNPKLMGEWYSGWLDAKKIVEDYDIPGKMLQLINSGVDIEGWRIQGRRGNRHYAKNAILALIQSGLDLDEIASCVKINPEALDKLLKRHPDLEIPDPYVSPDSRFVIRTNNRKKQ